MRATGSQLRTYVYAHDTSDAIGGMNMFAEPGRYASSPSAIRAGVSSSASHPMLTHGARLSEGCAVHGNETLIDGAPCGARWRRGQNVE